MLNSKNIDSKKPEKRKSEDNQDQVLPKVRSRGNRYFSEENVKKICENSETGVKKTNLTENEQLNRPKDYLIQRLLTNRTLSGIEKDDTEDFLKAEEGSNTVKINVSMPARIQEFQDDFIPLSKIEPEKKKDNNQKIQNDQNLDNESKVYNGSYPFECMKKVTETVIEAFKPIQGATFTKRAAEIAKMKAQLPSKFDKDARLWRRIKRETYQIRQQLKNKIENCIRHERLMNSKNKKKKIYFVELSESSDTDFFEEVSNKQKKKTIKEKFDDIEDQNLNDSSSESSDDSDMDSKYAQFGKYSKKIDKQNKKAKNNKNIYRKSEKESSKSNIDNSKLNMDDELEMLRKQYRSLRKARNRSMNSIKKNVKDKISKQTSLEIDRKIMNDEITQVRRMIKKLTKKSKTKGKKENRSNSAQVSQSNSQNVNKKVKKK